MARYAAWCRKEWQEHRIVLLSIFAGIPVLVALAYWAMGEHLNFFDLDAFPAIALMLPFVAIGFDLFSRELRRGTHALVLRTPGAFGAALAAKLTVVLLAAGAAVLLEEASRAAMTAMTGLPHTSVRAVSGMAANGEPIYTTYALGAQPVNGLPGTLLYALQWLAAGIFGVLASTWITRGIGTSIAGVAWLAALAAPLMNLSLTKAWFFMPVGTAFVLLLLGAALLGLLTTAYCWLRGRRFLSTGPSAVLRGLALTGVVAGLAYAAGGVAYARWMDVTPSSSEFGIGGGWLGAGGKTLFLNVHRGSAWDEYTTWRHDTPRGTPPIPWIVDVATGDWRPAGEPGSLFDPPRLVVEALRRHPLDPLPAIALVAKGPGRLSIGPEFWLAGADGAVKLRQDLLDPPSRLWPMARESIRALTTVRDSTGQKTWLFRGFVEKEGDASPDLAAGTGPMLNAYLVPIPGGWTANSRNEGLGDFGWVVLDADTRARVPERGDRRGLVDFRALSPRYALHTVNVEGGDGKSERRYAVLDLATGETRTTALAKNAAGDLTRDSVVGVVARDTLLLALPRPGTANDPRDLLLSLWNPVTDARTPLSLPAVPDERVGAVHPPYPLADGRSIVHVFRGPPAAGEPDPVAAAYANLRSRQGESAPLLGPYRGANAWILIDPSKGTVRRLTPWSSAGTLPIALDVDDSLLAIEDGKRVVRFGADPEKRTVVFPR